MLSIFYWFLIIELIGIVAFPLAFASLPCLSDRGYSVAKPLGLLFLSWLLWMLGSLHILPTNSYTLWGLLSLLSIVSGWYGYLHHEEILAFIRKEYRIILIGEGVFFLFYLSWIIYRSYDPSINTTEQPMDFAILNASIIANIFPPEDPWLRGYDVPYYYFGYLMMGNLTELAFVSSRISYNLSLALIPALAALAAFGIVYNLIRAHGSGAFLAVRFALLAPVLLLVVSNLEGVLEFIRLREWMSQPFWDWLGIKDLGLAETHSWRPTDYNWWWRSTRVIDTLNSQGSSLDYTITEFPFFSFLLGDLHPHVMSIPFILLFLSFSLNAFLSPTFPGMLWVRSNLWTIFLSALLLGALAFINIWDIVPFGLLWAMLLIFKNVGHEENLWIGSIRKSWLTIVITFSVAILIYIPYYLSLDSQASAILPVGDVGTRPVHLLIIWGLFLVILLPFLVRQMPTALSLGSYGQSVLCPNCGLESSHMSRSCIYCDVAFCEPLRVARKDLLLRSTGILSMILLPFFIWAAWQLGWSTLTWSTAPLLVISERFLNTVPLMILLFVALYSLMMYVESGASSVMVFVLTIISLAMFLIFGPEFLRVDDLFHNRMNTVFKTYYQAWVLLAIASAFSLYFLSSNPPLSSNFFRIVMMGWWCVVGVLFMASLYYPVESALTKSGQFRGNVTLDGLAYVSRDNPSEYAAINWLQDNVKGGDGVLEAVGDSWSSYSRISSSTGLPTVLGWVWHEHQWRGSKESFVDREKDVSTIYSTQDASVAINLLNKYDIQYVVLGPREKASYGYLGHPKFSRISDIVFSQGRVTIYRVRE